MFFKDIIVYFYWLGTEFENLKKDQRYTIIFLLVIQIPDGSNCKMSIASNFVNNSYWVKLPF